MADGGRRHSVDIPIVKALVALRRVRSLKDPSTNSTTAFSSFVVDNINWETNSSNGISLHFPDHFRGVYSDNKGSLRSANFDCKGQKEEPGADLCYYHKPRKGLVEHTFSSHLEGKHVEESDSRRSNHARVYGHESLIGRDCSDYRDKELELTCVTPSTIGLDDVEFNNEQIIELSPQEDNLNNVGLKSNTRYLNRVESPLEAADFASLSGGSSYSTSFFANESFEDMDGNDHVAGVSCCLLMTPRFSDSNFHSGEDNVPLLRNEIVPYVENSRSLIHKYKPRSFTDLVGHNVVSRSLLTAISKGRIAPFYIFHGPRGTGKSSASRVFAAALNCLSLEEHKPCGNCRECKSFFNGKSKNVKEVDFVRINSNNRLKSFIKNAVIPPVTSRFKIFIIDECQFLGEDAWATILNSFDDVSQNLIFILVTTDIDKVPRSIASRSQKYHFPKIKDVDIANKLEKISINECLDFDQVALEFVAAKSNGSLRDAEMMLDQLSLIGKRITKSLVYELIGIVPDDELIGLLDLALSGDTSKTVNIAREMMRSGIDPQQLISQLANLIMDILAGKCQENTSQVKRDLLTRHTSEADTEILSRALKVLSETEKQLRGSKNQMTWLTAALLQLSSVDSTLIDPNDYAVDITPQLRGTDFCSTPSTPEISKCLVPSARDANKARQLGMHECEGKLETIWKKATGLCQSRSLRNFLWNEGKLSSIRDNQGLIVVELDFHHHCHVAKAERSWKLIASSLQSVMGCNVGIRINLVSPRTSTKKLNLNKSRLYYLCCSCVTKQKPLSISKGGPGRSDVLDLICEQNCTSNTSGRKSLVTYFCR